MQIKHTLLGAFLIVPSVTIIMFTSVGCQLFRHAHRGGVVPNFTQEEFNDTSVKNCGKTIIRYVSKEMCSVYSNITGAARMLNVDIHIVTSFDVSSSYSYGIASRLKDVER